MKNPSAAFKRLESRIERSESGCWIWRGATNSYRYGTIRHAGQKVYMVHRLVYELLKGPIEPGLTIDHLCRVRNCVNPKHMEPVSVRENTLRGVGPTSINAKKTHCKFGHLLSGDNLHIKAGKRHERVCKICRRRNEKKYHSKEERP